MVTTTGWPRREPRSKVPPDSSRHICGAAAKATGAGRARDQAPTNTPSSATRNRVFVDNSRTQRKVNNVSTYNTRPPESVNRAARHPG